MGQSLTDTTDTIGYIFNNGGLNNQKLALLGLCVYAFKEGRRLALPLMLDKDYVGKNHQAIEFEKVFDKDLFLKFLQNYGVDVVELDPRSFGKKAKATDNEKNGWSYFDKGSIWSARLAIRQEVDEKIADFVFDFFKNLVPVIRESELFRRVKAEIFETNAVEVAAQFRIELDWTAYSTNRLKWAVKKAEDYLLRYDQIVEKIKLTLPETRKILVFCDERALMTPKEEMREFCRTKMDVDLFWKSDFIGDEEIAGLNNFELSLLDFELAMLSRNYIGLSRSSFSNMVTFEKFAQSRQLVTSDYIYNLATPELGLRKDNGGKIAPAAVIA